MRITLEYRGPNGCQPRPGKAVAPSPLELLETRQIRDHQDRVSRGWFVEAPHPRRVLGRSASFGSRAAALSRRCPSCAGVLAVNNATSQFGPNQANVRCQLAVKPTPRVGISSRSLADQVRAWFTARGLWKLGTGQKSIFPLNPTTTAVSFATCAGLITWRSAVR
jgi:hypothetical protein